jgi:hypothetical protein
MGSSLAKQNYNPSFIIALLRKRIWAGVAQSQAFTTKDNARLLFQNQAHF